MRLSSALLTQNRTDLSAAILDVAGTVILTMDLEGRVIQWNQAAGALTGISAEHIHGHIFPETLLFSADLDNWNREFNRICAGSASRSFAVGWKGRGGARLSLTCSFTVVRDSTGCVESVVCTVADSAGPADRASLFSEFQSDRTAELRDISRFLHDTISQDLVALSFDLNKVETTAPDVPSRISADPTHADSTLDLIDRCCRDVRAISFMLEPPSLLEATLESSIERYTDDVREETGLEIAVDLDPVPDTVSPEARLLFLTAVQEWAARGIRCHPAAKLSIRLRNRTAGTMRTMETMGTMGTMLELEMLRSGCPLPNPEGWAIVCERARALGGEFEITRSQARIFARLSLPETGDHGSAL